MKLVRTVLALPLFVATAILVFGQAPQNATLKDPVTLLARRIEAGEVKLDFDAKGHGYLPSLLHQLDVNADSQILVFSKTSFQAPKITPKTPRAVFFNDSVGVGSVQEGEVFELTSLDPVQGIVYYTMEAQQTDKPRFVRRFSECLFCHGPANGLVVSSVFPAADGTPFVTGTFFESIDQTTPIEKRWGGWYVTGTHGSIRHMGNAIAPNDDRPYDLEESGTQNLTTLEGRIDTTKYLSPTSDIVALMTLEHQTRMTNLIIGASRLFRRAANFGPTEKSKTDLEAPLDVLTAYMLFSGEAPLSDPIQGVSTFTATFPQRGPRDPRGRSLRDFDLKKRLFRHPLSYMIYSDIFDAMPAAAREGVYRRLFDVLTGKDQTPKFAHLSGEDRRAIFQILRNTKSNLPDYWHTLETY